MRKFRIEQLLVGTALAFVIAAPVDAAPTVRSVAPPPPSFNGQTQRHIAPTPSAPGVIQVPPSRSDIPAPAARPENTTSVDGAEWADNLPKLLQAKVVQSFENAKQLKSVSKPIDQLEAEYRLELSIRSFQISQQPTPAAQIELAARLVTDKGEVKDARIFKVSEPAAGTSAEQAAAALNKAFANAARELVVWAADAI